MPLHLKIGELTGLYQDIFESHSLFSLVGPCPIPLFMWAKLNSATGISNIDNGLPSLFMNVYINFHGLHNFLKIGTQCDIDQNAHIRCM